MKRLVPTDGLGPKEIKHIRSSIRLVWHRSLARRLCVKRSIGPDGFYRCEQCLVKVPKVFIDHTEPVGDLDSGFIARLFCKSSGLRALCKACHGIKTKAERKLKPKR